VARLIWTKRALSDFEALLEFIARDAPVAAHRFAKKIMYKIELLETNPHLGSRVSEIDSPEYREILQGSYRIIYRVENDVVYIITIYHASRLLGDI